MPELNKDLPAEPMLVMMANNAEDLLDSKRSVPKLALRQTIILSFNDDDKSKLSEGSLKYQKN